jgi:hypothetical protein
MDSLRDMGARLAEETAEVMGDLQGGALTPRGGGRTPRSAATAAAETTSRGAAPPRLSFVGHSIGNLIIRAALTHPAMRPFLGRLHTFLSISGPHLGYLHSPSSMSLFETGLRVLRTLKPSARCLHEITFSDAKKLEDCYLFRLAHAPEGLAMFRHVLLVSSPQDKYVPHHSARVQLAGVTLKRGSKRAAALRRMAEALLRPLLAKAAEAAAGAADSHWTTDDSSSFHSRSAAATRAHDASEREGAHETAVEDGDEDAVAAARRSNVTSLLRADVHFAPPLTRSLNAMIGRKAHIDFLETDTYIKFLLWKQRDKFV